MSASRPPTPRRYRVWIARVEGWQPADPGARPPRAWAVEPAETEIMSARQAQQYTLAFNRAILRSGRKWWAVAVPVDVRYDGEPRPGEMLVVGD